MQYWVSKRFNMQKRFVGFVLAMLGFSGMALAGYLFVTGSGDRIHLLEVTIYMIVGAACFFAGLNFIYDSFTSFTDDQAQGIPELEEVSELQQQWRTIDIARPAPQPAALAVSEL